MSGWILFATGLMVSLMCLAGLVFTIVEVRRLGREAEERATALEVVEAVSVTRPSR